jgi:hypothetical protein
MGGRILAEGQETIRPDIRFLDRYQSESSTQRQGCVVEGMKDWYSQLRIRFEILTGHTSLQHWKNSRCHQPPAPSDLSEIGFEHIPGLNSTAANVLWHDRIASWSFHNIWRAIQRTTMQCHERHVIAEPTMRMHWPAARRAEAEYKRWQ